MSVCHRVRVHRLLLGTIELDQDILRLSELSKLQLGLSLLL